MVKQTKYLDFFDFFNMLYTFNLLNSKFFHIHFSAAFIIFIDLSSYITIHYCRLRIAPIIIKEASLNNKLQYKKPFSLPFFINKKSAFGITKFPF